MSGLLLISICRKLTIPAISKALNTTSGKTGLRIDQAEILRKSTSVFLQALTSGLLKMRPDLLPWIEESHSGDRKSVVQGQSVSVRVDLGGSGIITKTTDKTIKKTKN